MMPGKNDEAAAAYRKVLEVDPKNIAALLKLAEYDLTLRNFTGATGKVDEILKISSRNPQALFLKGRLELAGKQFKEAIGDQIERKLVG